MVLSPRLQLSQTQKLMMNPQMRQAIELLQLTNVQLVDMLKREMEQNPFLAFDADHFRDAGHTTAADEGPRAVTIDGTSGVGLSDKVEAVRVDFALQHIGGGEGGDITAMLENRAADEGGLNGHILHQIGEEIADREVAALAVELTGWLDEDGYLREGDDEVCQTIGVEAAVLRETLAQVQAFTPAGVFARNLADCLRLQLQAAGNWTPTYQALLDNLDVLGRGDMAALAEAMGVAADALPPYLQTIRGLDPRPAAAYDTATTTLAQPDVIVLEGNAGWQAYLNEDSLPSVLVLERDWEEMAARKITNEERNFMKANVQSARWLKKATQQRAATMLRVARAIVARQQAFFSRGLAALEPMGLRDIAEDIEMHESTVSRSVAGKLVQTANGQFGLNDLFSVAVGAQGAPGGAGASGGNTKIVSAQAVKAHVAAMVAAEDALTGVLSDDALVALLAEKGIVVARRTVAKYRGALNIASSAQRRRAAKIAGAARG
ncbi:MAG: RNA polymerase factor sigma-54 [PS1 clade bacterium]|uniref:RNA polymerase sigma-54 factor n=1 Tax=PS1 clade bacterium TaxID=2175152 RepID=A0A937HNG5_9PROT|nr:RNA polymerase factor sigma-54 [PS1 clade bacterium]